MADPTNADVAGSKRKREEEAQPETAQAGGSTAPKPARARKSKAAEKEAQPALHEIMSVEHGSQSKSFERNAGIPLDLGPIYEAQVNRPALLRRCKAHTGRRCVKKTHQLGWLARIVSLIDLTTLAGDDTPSNVQRLCAKAMNPIRADLVDRLGLKDSHITCGAICVYPNRVKDAVQYLAGSGIPVASVAAGFPAGQTPFPQRIKEITTAVADGAQEIDIVISREHVVRGQWEELYTEIQAMRQACGPAHLKTILAVGELPTFKDVYRASMVAMMAGADFIKTSTGKESVNATLPVGLIMMRAVRDYYEMTGFKVGFKPAGGIKTAKDSLAWLSLMYEELGEVWTHPNLFRIGASSLLRDVERQLHHGVTGEYASGYSIPLS